MKRVILVMLSVMLLTGLVHAKDPEGYNGIKWGTPYSKVSAQLKGACLVEDGNAICTVENDKLPFDGNVYGDVVYMFDADYGFAIVMLEAELSKGQDKKVFNYLAKTYGPSEEDGFYVISLDGSSVYCDAEDDTLGCIVASTVWADANQ